MEKVIRDGKVAVIYSPRLGFGWYSKHNIEKLLFHPDLVELIEQGASERITEKLINKILGTDTYVYLLNVENLAISWIPVGVDFRIREHNGGEWIEIKDSINWITA